MGIHIYGIEPGDWIKTEDGERLVFLRYSSTRHWGFFAETRHHRAKEYKLPLSGLKLHKDQTG